MSIKSAEESSVSGDQLLQVLAQSPFARIYNFSLHSFGCGACTLIVPFDTSLERPGGIVAGSVLICAADVAMWLAIVTRLGTDSMAVTSELSTTFLSSARREAIHCTASIMKLGKTLIYGTATCSTESGKLLTHHTSSYVRMKTSRSLAEN